MASRRSLRSTVVGRTQAIVPPAVELRRDGAPGGEVVGQLSPLAAGPEDVEDGVEEVPPVHGGRADTGHCSGSGGTAKRRCPRGGRRGAVVATGIRSAGCRRWRRGGPSGPRWSGGHRPLFRQRWNCEETVPQGGKSWGSC